MKANRLEVPVMPEVKPSRIRLEASSHCQLRCPSCPTTTKAIHPAVGSGHLRLRDFHKLVDTNHWIRLIELSNYGEIFLNPELLDIIKYAHQRRVALTASNGVNFNNVPDEVLEGLVKYEFRGLRCSIDGVSNETYARYRVRGDFGKVIDNIRKLNRFKQEYRSKYPELVWQFIVFGHNEHQIAAARKLANELGMAFTVKLSWDPDSSPIHDEDAVRKEVGAVTRAEYKERHGHDYMEGICHQLWDQPQINWDGRVLGCCRNFWGDFATENAFRDGLLNSINSEKMEYARGMLLGKNPERADIPCTTCDIYLGMKATRTWLQRPSAFISTLRLAYGALHLDRFRSWFSG
jgi:MoaA/NifB/PqqE/SkfB family radical SAM enzyme